VTHTTRRALIAGLPLAWAGAAQAQALDPSAPPERVAGLLDIGTPQMALGPFFPIVRPHDANADLTRIGRNGTRALGEVIDVTGVVTRADGAPVRGAILEIWQAAASGAYNHPGDPNTAPRDPNFQGFARLRTDDQGRYRFRTIKPGPYGARAPHIHFDVTGRHRRLITQMLFPGEGLNATDNVLLAVRSQAQRDRAIAQLAEGQPGDPALYAYSVVLGGE
jgi:protocatechuate 3,4-dioxygenase, beta subunit